MKRLSTTIIAALLFCIVTAQAEPHCSKTGTTVVFVNGMNAVSEDAIGLQTKTLGDQYTLNYPNNKNIFFKYAYNPSRGEGMDLVKSIMQSCSASNDVGDIDLLDMLNQLNERITTERVVFVGHSQGTLYTNALYNRVNAQQLPTQSLGLINIATPSHYVPGGGSYITSTNDTVINAARAAQFSCLRGALPANIYIPYTDIDPAGHKFTEVYLEHAGAQIVRSIHDTIQRLSVDTISRPKCIDPEIAISWEKTKRVALAVSAPVVNGTYHSVKGVSTFSTTTLDMTTYAAARGADQLIALGNATIGAAQFTYNTSRAIVGASMNLASSVLFSTPVQAQSSAAVLAVVPSITTPETELYHPVTFEPLPNVQPEVVPPQSVLSEEPITWEYIPERDASYIPVVAAPHTVVSTPVTGSAPGGSEVYIDVPPPLPQPIILMGGAGQGGGGAPTLEPSAPVLTPLTCAPPEVLNADSTACVIPDTTPPTLAVTLSGCLSLVATDTTMSCLAHTSPTPTLSWVAEAGSTVSLNDVVVTDTSVSVATSAILTAVDAAGNVATKNITITSDATPLLISEVGYPLDTPQDTAHQYVELYNTTNTALDISTLHLESSRTEGDPALPQFSFPLAGTIQPHSYFLITNDFDIADTVEDMTMSWPNGLANTSTLSHQLLLKQGTAVLDSLELSCPTLSTTCHTTGHPFALERSIRRSSAVDYAYSLEQNNTQFVFTSGTTRFVGSPGRRNTADYVVSTLSNTLSTEYSPYYIHALEVPAGATGTIDAGVILTMRSGAGIHVNGTLIINGTATNQVVVSSADRWSGFTIASGGNLSATHTTVSNAGIGNSGSDTGAVKNRGGVVVLSDVTMTDVQPNGFFQDDGSATLTNVSITTATYPENAIKVRGGKFIFNGGMLSNFSDFGFHITGAPVCTISNITVTGVRSARTSGSEVLCTWDAVTHNGSPL